MGLLWGIFGSHLAFEVVEGDTATGVSSGGHSEPGLVLPTTTNTANEADP